jgi:hypothetical protein
MQGNLPKDLTPEAIEKLKQTAKAYPSGQIPANFDPNNFVFHSNTGLILMLTLDSYGGSPRWNLSMSYARRAPRDDEARSLLTAFFGEAGNEARKVIKPEGAPKNVLHFVVDVQ